jgi:hypothetical protein
MWKVVSGKWFLVPLGVTGESEILVTRLRLGKMHVLQLKRQLQCTYSVLRNYSRTYYSYRQQVTLPTLDLVLLT